MKPEYVDIDARVGEILQDLAKDGYPVEEQWAILLRGLALLIGRHDTIEDLNWHIRETQELIDTVSRQVFDIAHGR
jgi:hypothetical protein